MSLKTEKYLKIFAWLVLIGGVVFRVLLYLQNRDLFIDEANVARNIYERGFGGLAMPLSYEQYAPPVFLWLTKLFSVLFGFGEMALRILPLLASIVSLYVLLKILERITSYRSLWYPLGLMGCAFVFIHFASELKQYSTDVLVCLSLILLALKCNVQQTTAHRFILWWCIVGSIAIWFSMPSVFILAGVGAYYFFILLKGKDYKKLLPLFAVAGVWVLQFVFYYFAILKQQANSSYLQNFHEDYFLYLVPDGKEQLMHNWYIFKDMILEAGGYSKYAWQLNTLLMLLGAIRLLLKDSARAILIIVPIVLTAIAAGLHQYSLILRLSLFMIPLLLILAGSGLELLMSIRITVWQLAVAIVGLYFIKLHAATDAIKNHWQMEQVTESMAFLKEKQITGKQLFVHWGAKPAFIYYTQIHPQKEQWGTLKDATLVEWYNGFDSLAQSIPAGSRVAFMYSSIGDGELEEKKLLLKKYMTETDKLDVPIGRKYAFIYQKP